MEGMTEPQIVIQGTTMPAGTTVTIIQDPNQPGQLIQADTETLQVAGLDEPGVAEALLNIASTDIYLEEKHVDMDTGSLETQQLQIIGEIGDEGGEGDQGSFIDPHSEVNNESTVVIHQEGQTEGLEEQEGVEQPEGEEEEERQKMLEDIRGQMKELCNQMSDLGEESYLVSVRLRDGVTDHLGSIKGEHFVLLRQEMVQDFSDFCLGVEEGGQENMDFSLTNHDTSQDHQYEEQEDEEDEEEEEDEEDEEEEEEDGEEKSEGDNNQLRKTRVVRVTKKKNAVPRVIVMKKTDEMKGKVGDHQYTTSTRRQKSSIDYAAMNSTGAKDVKERSKTNILFLCDICKNVFPDLKDLKNHKLEAHNEGDYHCNSCTRIFSASKSLERHELDAHSVDGGDRFLCDSCVLDFSNKEELEAHNQDSHNPELPMKCDVCEQTFADISALMDHRKSHFDYDCFCTKCWQGFFDFLELETHIQSNCRYKEALYKCDICGKKYTKLHAINKHIDSHPIHSPHVCRMCGRGFDSEKGLKMHKTSAHIVRAYKCEFCEKTFKKKDSLVEHRRVHLKVKMYMPTQGNMLSDRFVCNICGIVLHSPTNLEQHMQRHEEGTEEHPCDMCDKRFFSRSLLIVHCRKEHKIFITNKGEENSEMIACEWQGCNKMFMDRTKWKYHMKYHRDRADKIARGIPVTPKPEAVECPLCGKTLKYKSYLKLHMQSHTGERPHQCDVCGNSYASQKRLNDHIRAHKGEKPFKCRVCDKHFTSTSLRNQHMVVHWGSKTYICDVCGKGFMSRKHFHDHMRIHAGEQPHKCETCGKDFIYYRSLVRHALTHIDPKERPKPYKCAYCGKEYTEVTGYKHHLRSIHTGENPFQCDICGEGFHRNDKLKRHMKSRHNKQDKPTVMRSQQTHIVTTRRQAPHGAPIIIKTEAEPAEGGEQYQMIPAGLHNVDGSQNELHVDVIQENAPRVLLIGVGVPGEDGDTTYVQETQVIEGPDGVRYIIAGTGEELQVIESSDIQQFEEADIQEADQSLVAAVSDGQLTFSADQETLATLASMASVAEVADVVQQQQQVIHTSL